MASDSVHVPVIEDEINGLIIASRNIVLHNVLYTVPKDFPRKMNEHPILI